MSQTIEQILNSFVEICIKHPDDFLKIKETLERIGIANVDTKTLYQSCHIFHKRGKLYITHFKELFILDRKHSSISDTDIGRRNTICRLMSEWGLMEIVDPDKIADNRVRISSIKIIPYAQKREWKLISKYSIGAC